MAADMEERARALERKLFGPLKPSGEATFDAFLAALAEERRLALAEVEAIASRHDPHPAYVPGHVITYLCPDSQNTGACAAEIVRAIRALAARSVPSAVPPESK